MSNFLQDFSPEIRAMLNKKHVSSSEVINLIKRYKSTRSPKIKEQMKDSIIENNSKLILSICIKARRKYNTDLRDMFQMGIIGLLIALEKFKVSRNNKFSTYAVFWIRHMVNEGQMSETTITLPRDYYYTYSKVNNVLGSSDNGRNDVELKRALKSKKIKAEDFDRMVKTTKKYYDISNPKYLDRQISVNGELIRESGVNTIKDENAVNPAIEAEKKETEDMIQHAIDRYLTKEEKEIIKIIYFENETNMKNVAKIVGLSYKTAIYHKNRAIKKLKTKLDGILK
jgi:RNA polymerase primary sigma factor